MMVVTSTPPTKKSKPRDILIKNGLNRAGVDLSAVWMTSAVKCPVNDTSEPSDDEITKCLPFLFDEFKIFRPDIIITVGRVPYKAAVNVPNVSFVNGRIASTQKYFGDVKPIRVTYGIVYSPTWYLKTGKSIEEFEANFSSVVSTCLAYSVESTERVV